ncbi:Rhodanese domain protein [Gloeothece citriformis PCC 7424]|uniref:Rhodanese domain protein n=1 Tax=Gloeothece citriformis (strain PCC 7424) TaxID=65393 RepID=B7KB28_GLOC7|nr:rhodanese-like domain-containing protein [Gloeothece citriformis]ACK70138.1 Rhodanese domain protein [Gloeothece citriformis PCC 7424]
MEKLSLTAKKRKQILRLGLLTFLITFLIFLTPLNALAVSFNSQNNENLFQGIDEFLTSIPKNYYTLMKVDDLKNIRNLVLIDVREPSEYYAGHIPHAINIPLPTLTQNLAQIPQEKPVVLYCSSGYRSAMGVMTLHLLGYDNVRGFPPSIAGWKTAGEPIEIGNVRG